jgi:malate synthase
LYGTDVISEENGAEKGSSFNPLRGEKVIAYGRELLDQYVPLADANWKDITGFQIENGELHVLT